MKLSRAILEATGASRELINFAEMHGLFGYPLADLVMVGVYKK